MKLAARQAELSACPYVSEEAKAQLDSASAPPIRLVTVGKDGSKVEVGNETVVFRHEKTFYPSAGPLLPAAGGHDRRGGSTPAAGPGRRLPDRARGQTLRPDGVAIEAASGSAERLSPRACARRRSKDLPIILISLRPGAMEAGLEAARARPPAGLRAPDADNWEQMAALAKKHAAPLAVRVPDGDLDALADAGRQVTKQGVEDLVLDPGTRGWADSLAP